MFGLKACAALAAIAATIGLCAPVQAGAGISAWVSAAGQDVSGCGIVTSPCRTFQYAHDNILGANGGDILVRDSGNYGPLNITKSVSVVNDSAGTAGTGAPANQTTITVNTLGAVLLKGLTLDGVNGAYNGVTVLGPGNVTIASCTVMNFSRYGVYINASTGNVNFSIMDTLVQNSIQGVGTDGIGPYSVSGDLNNVRIVGNSLAGVNAAFLGAQHLTIADTLISRNNDGLFASGASAVVALRHSTITSNTQGYNIVSPAVVQTYGDNVISGNGGNSGTLTPVSPN
ncbi:right-handed parallel beta-helix repeat-containing protein [Methylocystis heyeri]|uniref:Right handed beta helix domain-containing protein n=1 Tax=Methylocystis heyeri TaxID=391905 RepID=A0A6B8KBU9_9HYPH|nr:right-handed parallel beta-helix repeat-containing protein [Methylocystis heyeri]QGM44521.1 hypothetical protein H2LOC_001755 [Methylocystis heyeri]